jgi:bacterioferritin-associated ferredoxin
VIFCHCAVVGDRQVAEAIDGGADTVASVCRATGAGQQCGTCIFSVRRVVCEHQAKSQVRTQAQATPAIGVDVAAS